jgi:putative colanic acid biosynthesis UDP-glucose lipid carrier transferase
MPLDRRGEDRAAVSLQRAVSRAAVGNRSFYLSALSKNCLLVRAVRQQAAPRAKPFEPASLARQRRAAATGTSLASLWAAVPWVFRVIAARHQGECFVLHPKIDVQITLLTFLRVVLVPSVAIGSLIVSTSLLEVRFTEPYVALAIIAALLTLLVIARDALLQTNLVGARGFALAGRIGMGWLAVVGVLLLLGYATKSSEIFSRRALFLWFLVTPPILVATTLGVQQWLRALLVSSRYTRSAVIVGTTKMALELARTLQQRPELGMRLRCVFVDEGAGDVPLDEATRAAFRDSGGPEIRKGGSIGDYVNARRIDVVFIAREAHAPDVRELCNELRNTTSSVYLIPDVSLYDLMQARVGDVDGIPVIALCESPLHGGRGAIKRMTDIVFATLLLIVAAPIMVLIAIAIKLDSPGRIIFTQDRYGLDGERIVVYKFRTMTVCENGSLIVQAKRNDARVTKVGRILRRTSLDELPQLINVLQGRMSLVGPRPHAVAHNEEYRKLISGYMVRHKVTPGITGLAQVSGCRGETSTVDEMRRRVQYDLEYLRHWCWLLDLKILLRTLVLVFRDKRAY